MAAPTLHRHFTAAEYERMVETGVLAENERIELLDGEIYTRSPIGARHAQVVNVLNDVLGAQIGRETYIGIQNPIRLGERSRPQPDIAVLRRRNYTAALPTPADVLLVIEVADSSHVYDRATKFPIYAAAGIPEAWLVDLTTDTVERHSEPRDRYYRQITIARAGETLASTVIAELVIVIDTILGTNETP